MPLINHHPFGIEHPYARSLDQRFPSQPLVGQPLTVGVSATEPLRSVSCIITWPESETRLAMMPVNGSDTDAALLAGGEGHLASAQQAALASDNGWQVTIDQVPAGDAYYRFEAEALDGRIEISQSWDWAPAAWASQPRGVISGAGDKLVADSVEWLVSSAGVHRARFALTLAQDEHVIGFGERYDQLDQRGQCLDAVVFEQYKSQGKYNRTYLPMPFAHVVSNDGSAWGFYIETSTRTWYDVGASVQDRIIVEVDLGLSNSLAPGELPKVNLLVWQGTPAKVLDAFLDQVGRPEVMPDWIFGLWASGNEWNTQQRVMAQLDRHQDEDVPVGVVVIEAWSDEEGFTIFRDAQYKPNQGQPHQAGDFSYPPDGAWPDPAAMIQELHRRGIKVILWQIPLQKTEDALGTQAIAQREALLASGHVVREADGRPYLNRGWWFPKALMPDLSTTAGQQWWTAQRRYLVKELDIDGFKTDGGEHAWGRDLCYEDGCRGADGNNLYPVHYAKAYGDLMRSCGKPPITFSRSGFAGSQAHGLFWAGDEDSTWEGFRSSLIAGLTASACGIIYWGWDIAGFSGEVPEAELYARAFGTSAFLPIMQYHSEFNHHQSPLRDRTPWNVADQRNCPELIELARHFGKVRQNLISYLREQTQICVDSGKPLMRALFFEFGDDAEIWQHPTQYLLGEKLLVNPVTSPDATIWETYLPKGEWRDFWTGELHRGSSLVSREYSWSEVPVFRQES